MKYSWLGCKTTYNQLILNIKVGVLVNVKHTLVLSCHSDLTVTDLDVRFVTILAVSSRSGHNLYQSLTDIQSLAFSSLGQIQLRF